MREFRTRDLSEQLWPYLVIDARYERVRREGRVVKLAVLVAAGINEEGRREILGYYLGDSESEATWAEEYVRQSTAAARLRLMPGSRGSVRTHPG